MRQRREPGRTIPTLDEFIALWQTLPQAAAYMSFETWFELHQRGFPMRVVLADTRRVVVVKP